jgi:uncharacterized protein YkwD
MTALRDRRRRRAAAAVALVLASGTFAATASKPPRILVSLSPIGVGPDAVAAAGPKLGRPTLPPPAADRPYNTLSVDVADDVTLEQPLLAAINAFRRSHRLRPLTTSRLLDRAARAHVYALAYAGAFEHDWPGGPSFARWIRRYYPVGAARTWGVGENLLWSTGTVGTLAASKALSAWIASPAHLHNLLTPTWRQIGIAAVAAQGAQGLYGGQDVLILATDFGARG